jgi:hypothetical protein
MRWRYTDLNRCSESFSDPVTARFAAGSQTRVSGAQTSDPADALLRRQGSPKKVSIRNSMRQYIAGDEKEG